MHLSQVIIKPVLTEKSVRGTSEGKYRFYIHPEANKFAVKQALKALYGVNVRQVNIIYHRPKYRWGRNRQQVEKTGASKQAVITLAKGEKLDLSKLKS